MHPVDLPMLARCLCAGVLAWATSHPAAAVAPAAERSSAGLIVKLRDAPRPMGALALAAGGANPRPLAQAERMRHLLSQAGLGSASLRPVGLSAQLLDFGGPLKAVDAQRMAEQLRQRPEVEWVTLNEREHRLQVPNDPLFAANATSTGQWWLQSASGSSANAIKDRRRGVPGLPAAWASTTGHPQAVVAVLDTGITPHPDLAGHVLPGHDFVSQTIYANDGGGRDTDPSDPGDWVSQADKQANPAAFGDCEVETSSWHGTVIAGIVAAVTDNGFGVAGINWNGRVLPVRVAGKCGAEVADIVDGMRWAAGLQLFDANHQPLPLNANPARVINISFGGSAACSPAYQEAIDELRALGAVVVAAAGNGSGDVKRPANCAGVIGVAALNRDGFKATYSNFGPAVVVATVGGDPVSEGLWGPLLGDEGLLTVDNLGMQGPDQPTYSNISGTSFSTPVVAGVVSLMLSANPALSVAQVIEGVRRSARPHAGSRQMAACSSQNPGRCACTADTCGAGILDATQAVLFARAPASYVATSRPAAVVDSSELSAALALGPDLPPNPPTPATDSGGGGAPSIGWLALLGIAVAALVLSSRRVWRRG